MKATGQIEATRSEANSANGWEKIADPVDPDLIRREIADMTATDEKARDRRFSVFLATADRIPAILNELGRLREIAFRAVGEGTGRARDLDDFDRYYRHLFLWDRENESLAGAYRLALTDEVLSKHGADGLYCSTLFHFEPEFLDYLNPGVELGRSFIAPAYQRLPQPLPLMWKGLGAYLVSLKRYRHLFGPVSISQDYSTIAKYLMVEFMTRELTHPTLARFVQPRNPFRMTDSLDGLGPDQISESLLTAQEVSAKVSEIEPDGKGIPILLKHYLKLDATILSFNVDPAFNDALDALILIDLAKAPPVMLSRYLGREGVDELRRRFGTA
ncbi:MAG: GNAT family N-acetyltransferase [Verrucomicrobiae bacterium]|nr:GNAT family N-acetyltransferase [Verrucomicrobiae bacterium]